jgi:hypothetical protein
MMRLHDIRKIAARGASSFTNRSGATPLCLSRAAGDHLLAGSHMVASTAVGRTPSGKRSRRCPAAFGILFLPSPRDSEGCGKLLAGFKAGGPMPHSVTDRINRRGSPACRRLRIFSSPRRRPPA